MGGHLDVLSASLSTTLLLAMALAVLNSSLSLACNSDDKAALFSIKSSFPPNSFPQSWSSSSTQQDCCLWDYVRCGKHTGRVRYLGITNNQNLSGTIPTSIADLQFLEVLSLDSLPNLVGPIPPQLTKLTRLQQLKIQSTSVSGPIPPFLSGLASSITQIVLANNKLTGTIPASLDLSQFPNLTVFDVSSNQLTGAIPPLFYHNSKHTIFTLFSLANNMLTGDIPLSFSNALIQSISLRNNNLTANSAYVLFGESKPLEYVDFAYNQMAFNMTSLLFPNQIMVYMDISHNNIYGSIPQQITTTGLVSLDVSYNGLCGMIPQNGAFDYDTMYFQNNKCLCGIPLPPCN